MEPTSTINTPMNHQVELTNEMKSTTLQKVIIVSGIIAATVAATVAAFLLFDATLLSVAPVIIGLAILGIYIVASSKDTGESQVVAGSSVN